MPRRGPVRRVRTAHELALSHACAIGGGRAGTIETTFEEQCETDLVGEQVVLCGGLVELMRAVFETLTEMKLIVDLIHEGGTANMNDSILNTAEWGEYVSGPRIITAKTKAGMKRVLVGIQTGKFTSDRMQRYRAGASRFNGIPRTHDTHQVEVVGAELRAMMPWIGKK